MPPLALIGAGLAAIVASAAIMLKGGMVKRPEHAVVGDEPAAGGGSASGAGIPSLDDAGEDPFKRYPRARAATDDGGPLPTQTDTTQLANGDGTYTARDSSPTITYASAGDGHRTPAATPGYVDGGQNRTVAQIAAGLPAAPSRGIVQQFAALAAPTSSGGSVKTL